MADFTRAWSETFPPDTQPANQLGLDLRQFRTDARERFCNSGDDAAKPTNVGSLFVGYTYFAFDTGKIWQWSGTAWVDKTASFISNANVLHGVGSLAIPANYLQVGSLIQIDSFGSFNAPTVSNIVISFGSTTFTSSIFNFINGDFFHIHTEILAFLIVGGNDLQTQSSSVGRVLQSGVGSDIQIGTGGSDNDPTAIITVSSSPGVSYIKVFK